VIKNKNKFGTFKKEGHNCFIKITREEVESDGIIVAKHSNSNKISLKTWGSTLKWESKEGKWIEKCLKHPERSG